MSDRRPSATLVTAVAPIIHAALMSVLLLLFTWPAVTAEPRNVPIGLVGPTQITEAIAEKIESQRPGAFTIELFESPTEASTAIERKEIYGAIELGAQTRAIVATAGNSGDSQLITELGTAINDSIVTSQGIPVVNIDITELAPLPDADPRGQVLGSAALPLVIAGISLGALASFRGGSRWTQIIVVTAGSVVTGLSLTFVLVQGIAILPGDVTLTALAIAGVIGAVGVSLLGAHRLAGIGGFGALAATFFLLGNPLSGISIPVEFYPEGWGAIGQTLPLGAGFELIKRINFFELSETTAQWVVLASWILAGLTMWAVSFFRREKSASRG